MQILSNLPTHRLKNIIYNTNIYNIYIERERSGIYGRSSRLGRPSPSFSPSLVHGQLYKLGFLVSNQPATHFWLIQNTLRLSRPYRIRNSFAKRNILTATNAETDYPFAYRNESKFERRQENRYSLRRYGFWIWKKCICNKRGCKNNAVGKFRCERCWERTQMSHSLN